MISKIPHSHTRIVSFLNLFLNRLFGFIISLLCTEERRTLTNRKIYFVRRIYFFLVITTRPAMSLCRPATFAILSHTHTRSPHHTHVSIFILTLVNNAVRAVDHTNSAHNLRRVHKLHLIALALIQILRTFSHNHFIKIHSRERARLSSFKFRLINISQNMRFNILALISKFVCVFIVMLVGICECVCLDVFDRGIL